MSLRLETPCDFGECPYGAEYMRDCEYWCGAEEPADDPDVWEDEEFVEWDDAEDAEEYFAHLDECEAYEGF